MEKKNQKQKTPQNPPTNKTTLRAEEHVLQLLFYQN